MNKTKIYLISILICLFPSLCFGALTAGTVWEYQTTADANNGGGFYDRIPGTSVDYSQQTAAQLSLTDLAMATGGTTLTSATGGFTAAMAGNIIYIASGTHFTAGFYEIIVRTDTNTVTLDRDATDGTNGSAGVGKVGGALDVPVDADFDAFTSGDTIYIKAGTYSIAASITIPVACYIYGYSSVRGDAPLVDSTQPILALGAFSITFYSNSIIKNLEFTGTGNDILILLARNVLKNCEVTNSSGTADRNAIMYYGSSLVYKTKVSSPAGDALELVNGNAASIVDNCYIYDSLKGINHIPTGGGYGGGGAIVNNIFNNNTTAINVGAGMVEMLFINNNTLYLGTTGIALAVPTTPAVVDIKNNIICSYTTGISQATSPNVLNSFDYNFYYSCTITTSNVTEGPNSDETQTKNPGFVDAANGNFQIGSALRAKGYPRVFPGGLTTGYMSPGAVQPDPSKRVLIF